MHVGGAFHGKTHDDPAQNRVSSGAELNIACPDRPSRLVLSVCRPHGCQLAQAKLGLQVASLAGFGSYIQRGIAACELVGV